MRFIGNVIWFVFGGEVVALLWLLAGVAALLSIVGAPYAISCFQLAKLSAAPFGKAIVNQSDIDTIKDANLGTASFSATKRMGVLRFLFNVVWVLTFGWILALCHIVHGIIQLVLSVFTLFISVPFAIQSFKLARIAFAPVGKRVVSINMADQIETIRNRQKLGFQS